MSEVPLYGFAVLGSGFRFRFIFGVCPEVVARGARTFTQLLRLTNFPGHLWRGRWTTLSGPLAQTHLSRQATDLCRGLMCPSRMFLCGFLILIVGLRVQERFVNWAFTGVARS